MLPLYEAKMLHLYDTRWATYEADGSTRPMTEAEKAERLNPMPRYWVQDSEIDRKLGERWDKTWFLGWRDICRSTDARTVIATMGPRVAYGDKWLLAMPTHGREELQAAWASFVFDYAARQKSGGTSMKYFTFMQLPMPTASQLETVDVTFDRTARSWLGVRVDRLNGWVVDPAERGEVRAELDALMFHIYGLSRSEVSYVLDTFPIVKRKDEAQVGSYRTKELILAAYDAMASSRDSGAPYQAPWKELAR